MNAVKPQDVDAVKICTKAGKDLALTIRNNKVVLAKANHKDLHQHWIKDLRYGKDVKDASGFPSFALVNKATGQAIKHAEGSGHPVRLASNPNQPDQSTLWSEGRNTDEGFRAIRKVNDIRLNLDAFGADERNGGARDGNEVGLYEWLEGINQMWKIVPYGALPGMYRPPSTEKPTMRVYSQAIEDYSLAIRNGEVVLVPYNPSDDYQHWLKVAEYSGKVKDREDHPSFALVNKVTGQAIEHAAELGDPVRLAPYDRESYLVLWTEGDDLDDHFRTIRSVRNTKQCLDVSGADDGCHVFDGNPIILYEYHGMKNQRWRIRRY